MSYQSTFTLTVPAPAPFDFHSAARAHGWVALRPFEWHEPDLELRRVHQLNTGQVVRLRVSEKDNVLQIQIDAGQPLTAADEAEIRQAVRRMLRLDEDLSEFYQFQAEMGERWSLRLQSGGGRLLRCPTLFEDIVYTICTTNINWAGTKRMVERITLKFGTAHPGQPDWIAFPRPEVLAATDVEFLQRETGLGYRSAYVWALASAVAEGRLNLASLEDPILPADELLKALRQIKGIGPYGAATLMMILGRYEHLAIDSELRAHVSRKYLNGQRPTDAQIQAIYEPWGRWRYLAYWFDTP